MGIYSVCKSLWIFCATCCLVPVILVWYPFVSVIRRIWLFLLKWQYPELAFSPTNTVRSIADTVRNPGILHIVLQVEGEAWNADAMKTKMFEHVLERRNKDTSLAFPYMKCTLHTKWGHYAWADASRDFDIDNHVIFSQEGYRGRPVTDANVQMYLSEQTSKFLSLTLPPWQIIIVPIYQPQRSHSSSSENPVLIMDHYYILLRFHHLLLSDMPNLRICDLLLVESGKPAVLAEEKVDEESQFLPFSNLIESPNSILELYSRITVAITNRWNEFIYRHDPLESPDGFKMKVKELSQLLSLILIAGVCVVSDFCRGYHAIRAHPSEKFKYFMSLVRREVRRRNLSWEIVGDCILDAVDPVSITRRFVRGFFWLIGQAIVIIPCAIIRECMAIRCCLFLGHCGYPNTIIGFLFEFTPLVYGVLMEILEAIRLIIVAPKCLYESLIAEGRGSSHGIKSVTICGRKIISWSEIVEKDQVKDCAKRTGASEAEISLTMLAASIKDALEDFGDCPVPKSVDVSARSVHQDCLMGRMSRSYGVDGVICLSLPLGNGGKEHLALMREILQEARRTNIALYTITGIETRRTVLTNVFTWAWIKLLTNYLSKKFCITITDTVENTTSRRYKTLWGHPVTDMIYFRPPMANTSLSLTLQKFGQHIRLGVIADAELTPCHIDIARSWTNYMRQF